MEKTVNITAETPAEKRLNQHPSIRMKKVLELILEIVSTPHARGEEEQELLQRMKDAVSHGLEEEAITHTVIWPDDVENSLQKIEENLDSDPTILKMRAALELILTRVDSSSSEEQEMNIFEDIEETARLGLGLKV